ncbi:T9SS type A sorting domain-containing protein, partial [candidate division WOR-3 bacterium]|nr:T9SS type A sorting domain-containing protein [candidate division WOR-3 bacterium]
TLDNGFTDYIPINACLDISTGGWTNNLGEDLGDGFGTWWYWWDAEFFNGAIYISMTISEMFFDYYDSGTKLYTFPWDGESIMLGRMDIAGGETEFTWIHVDIHDGDLLDTNWTTATWRGNASSANIVCQDNMITYCVYNDYIDTIAALSSVEILKWNHVYNTVYRANATAIPDANLYEVEAANIVDNNGFIHIAGVSNSEDSIYYWNIDVNSIIFDELIYGTGPVVLRPELISPANDTATANNTIDFIWNESLTPIIEYYNFNFSNTSNFADDSLIQISDTQINLVLTDTTYYWRVYAVDSLGNQSIWSDIWKLTIDGQIPITTLVYPINGEWVDVNPVIFHWNTAIGKKSIPSKASAVTYQLEADSLFSFVSPIYNIFTSDTFYSLSFLDGKYFWRITSEDQAGNVSITGIDSFILDNTPPGTPALYSPYDSFITNNSIISFEWDSVIDIFSGLDYYEIQFANNITFSPSTTVNTSTLTQYIDTLTDTIYYWHVRAIDNAGNQSVWSDIWQLTIDTQAPSTVTLMTPIDSQCLGDTSILFTWSEVTKSFYEFVSKSKESDAIKATPVLYTIEIDTVFTFPNPILSDTLDSNSLLIPVLSEGAYYWHIKADDQAGNEGVFCLHNMFTIDKTSPIIDSVTIWNNTTFSGPYDISLKVTDAISGTDSVFLYYKRPEDTDWIITKMHKSGNWFIDSIPIISHGGDVFYYLKADDNAVPTNTATSPVNAPFSNYSFTVALSGIDDISKLKYNMSINHIGNKGVDISLTVPNNCKLSTNLYDISGRLVQSHENTYLPGKYDVHYDLDQSGVFFVIIKNQYETQTVKLINFK